MVSCFSNWKHCSDRLVPALRSWGLSLAWRWKFAWIGIRVTRRHHHPVRVCSLAAQVTLVSYAAMVGSSPIMDEGSHLAGTTIGTAGADAQRLSIRRFV